MPVSQIRVFVAVAAAFVLLQGCSDESANEAPKDKVPAPSEPPASAALPDQPPAGLEAGVKPRVDACALLTLEEVEAAVGSPMEGPTAGHTAGHGANEGAMTSCSFASRSDTRNAAPAEILAELQHTWYVTVTVWSWPMEQGAANYVAGMRNAPMTSEPVRDVDGLGEEAVWNGTLHVRQGRVSISLDVRPPRSMDAEVDEVELESLLLRTALKRID